MPYPPEPVLYNNLSAIYVLLPDENVCDSILHIQQKLVSAYTHEQSMFFVMISLIKWMKIHASYLETGPASNAFNVLKTTMTGFY